jgi:hypothetical protein
MIVYLSIPTITKNKKIVENNVNQIILELWEKNFTVVSQCANSDLQEILLNKEEESLRFLNGNLDIIARCDAIMVLPNWEESIITKHEIEFAKERNIPISYYPEFPEISSTELLRPKQVKGYIDIIMNGYRVHLIKNADYSSANILGTGEIGLATRIWDKVARLLHLIGFNIDISKSEYIGKKIAKNESFEDNLIDLSVYSIIWQLYHKGIWGK